MGDGQDVGQSAQEQAAGNRSKLLAQIRDRQPTVSRDQTQRQHHVEPVLKQAVSRLFHLFHARETAVKQIVGRLVPQGDGALWEKI